MADIGPYRIIAPIGESAQALSYRAVHVHLEREVFLKVLVAGGLNWPERRGRFEREAKALARIDHPAVVKVWDFGEAEDRLYLASEFVRGPDLAQRIREGALTWDELKPMALALLDGLEALHEAGILHRDIKPSNIMLSDKGPKLADLGLARLLQSPAATQSDTLVGTPAYLDPETLRGGATDFRSDLFSLGATLYEALTGRRAFPGQTFQEVVHGLLEADPVKSLPPGTPSEARRFIAGLLEKNPSERPEGVAQARGLLQGGPGPVVPADRRPIRAWVAGGAAVLCVLVGMAVLRMPRRAASLAPAGPGSNAGSHDTIIAQIASPTLAPVAAAVVDSSSMIPSAKVSERSRNTTLIPAEPVFAPVPRGIPPLAEAADPTRAALWIATVPWAEIMIDGEVRDTTPLTDPLTLPAGRYQITMRHLTFPEVHAAVDLAPGARESLFVSLADSLGFLRVLTDPWASLQVDGVPVGTTPLAEPIALWPGSHEVMAENPFFSSQAERVRLGPGDTISIEIDLRKTPER
ncbi:serine/threonine protein kinase [Candidatus Fermentibacteria bacterium]|nr:serine/threonine protein kinase [Candidatus Fermentibacteria bacterium]